MREILFRGKRVSDGEWVQGNLFIPDIEDTPTQICIGTSIIRTTYDIDPKTIGQFTGLLDKNGKKIFEGDIVTSEYYIKRDKMINSVIEYGEWNCGCCYGVYGWASNGSVDFVDDDVIVIGNIHDNPELLKGDERHV